MNTAALIIVDVQNDFVDGALAVPNAPLIVPIINRLAANFRGPVVATMDWHPPGHVSFAQWPRHCVAGSGGAELARMLDRQYIGARFRKGMDRVYDSYSGFFESRAATGDRLTGLDAYLQQRDVGRVYVCGLATDYCVKATALDAVQFGYESFVITDASMGTSPESIVLAYEEMRKAGVKVCTSSMLMDQLATEQRKAVRR